MLNRFPKPPGVYVKLHPRRDEGKGSVWKIQVPDWLPSGPDVAAKVENIRLTSQLRREEMLQFQKQCSKDDRDGARFFKAEATDALKEYRAACLMLPLFQANPPGDALFDPVWNWPIELAPWVDRVIRACSE